MKNTKECDYNKFLGEIPEFLSVEEYLEDNGIDPDLLPEQASADDSEHLKSTLDHWSSDNGNHERYWKYARAVASALKENDSSERGDIIDKKTFEEILFNYLAPKIGMVPEKPKLPEEFPFLQS